jgi:hypothetical protein
MSPLQVLSNGFADPANFAPLLFADHVAAL